MHNDKKPKQVELKPLVLYLIA